MIGALATPGDAVFSGASESLFIYDHIYIIVIFVTSEAQFWPRTSASARVGEPKLRLRVANISFYHE